VTRAPRPLPRRPTLPALVALAAFAMLAAPVGGVRLAAQETGGRSTRDGVYTKEQAERGKSTFGDRCSYCHAVSQFVGPSFLKSWGGGTVAALFEYMSASMPQDMPASLEPREYADVIAYVLQKNGLPAGELELAGDADVLETIRLQPPVDDTVGGPAAHPPRRLPPLPPPPGA